MPGVPVDLGATADGFDADVIVIGSGSAGAAATRRLVDAGARVLLLEAGDPDENPAIHDPARVHELWGTPQDWAYETVPQAHASGRRLSLPRGKVLGGSSSLNAMIFVRGARADFDGWAAAGNEGWGWDDVLPVYRRMESHDRGASELHGDAGPLAVWTDYEPDPIHAALLQAATQCGLARNEDYNDGDLEGVASMQFSIREGVRDSAAAAYLMPICDHPSLRILVGAQATRVLVEGARAVGAEWRCRGALESARCDEIVVCAGAIESPRVLMLSGIGPAGHLREHGIDVVCDLPGVGANFHDHLLVPMLFAPEREVGPPSPGLPACQSHFWTSTREGLPGPDLQPIHFMVPLYEEWMEGPENAITLMPGLVRPESRGTIRLSGPALDDPLLIDPDALAADADLQTLMAGVDIIRRIAAAPALEDWGLRPLYPAPGDEVERYVRDTAITYHHQAGSCRMGIDGDAVVDPRLRVHGVTGLRVADASVMPAVTSGNTNAPSILMGERVADFMRAS